jgi:predicted nucleotidyltransferase
MTAEERVWDNERNKRRKARKLYRGCPCLCHEFVGGSVHRGQTCVCNGGEGVVR